MEKPPLKLVTWKNWAWVVGIFLGATIFHLIREYFATGSVSGEAIVIAVVVFCVMMGIASVMFWYANRPEKGNKS